MKIQIKLTLKFKIFPVLIRELDKFEFKNETGFDIFEHGTIIQIVDLNEEWIEFNKKTIYLMMLKLIKQNF